MTSKLILASISLMGMLTGCGLKTQDVQQTSDAASQQPTNATGPLVDISISVTNKQQSALFLAAATAYKLSIDGCASGYTANVTEVDPSVKVYKYDKNCLAKLTEVQFSGITYQPDAADPFTTWQAGDSATFVDVLDANNKIAIAVSSQLGNPISGTEVISYSFEEIQAGADKVIEQSVVSDTHNISVNGESAPGFTIAHVAFNGITATGAGEITIKLDCEENLTGSGATSACLGQSLSDLRYLLVEDTYGGSLDLPTAQSLFAVDGLSIDTASEVLSIGDADAVHGGFVTKLLTGPDEMHNHPNMIFIIEASGTSYRYFNIDITTL